MRIIGLIVLTAALLVPGVASAEDTAVVHDTNADPEAVRAYWTPERIAAMPVGPSKPGVPPTNGPDGAGFPTGTDIDRTVGRLFFVDHDGEDASCTATLVSSRNKATAVTGGHCVHTFNLIGQDPTWMDKLLFIPGFRDNQTAGGMVVKKIVVDQHWLDDDQLSEYDQAFLVLDQPSDHAQDIAFDLPGDQGTHQFGYPRAAGKEGHQGRPEFTGQRVARCWGEAHRDPAEEDQWGLECDMGGGSSGGPRFAGFDEQTGKGRVTGVNTYSFRIDDVRHLGGPRFTTEITGPLYDEAQAA